MWIVCEDASANRPDKLLRPMYLVQVKTAAESQSAWDLYKTVQEVSGEDAFTPHAESKCRLMPKA